MTGEDFDPTLNEIALPLYLNMRGYLPCGRIVSLFASLDVGTSIGLSDNLWGYNGLLLSPSVGVRLRTTNRQVVTIGLGYVLQRVSAVKMNADALQLKVGYSF